MAYIDLLNELSERIGIQTTFYHNDLDREVHADQKSKQSICRALGYPADTEKDVESSLHKLNTEYWQQFSPHVKVAYDNEISPLLLHVVIKDSDKTKTFSYILTREDGSTQSGHINLSEQQLIETQSLNYGLYHRYQIRLYLDVGIGYHSISFLLDDKKADSNTRTKLIVTPRQCYIQESLLSGHKAWGIPLQLYALKSKRNWGIGDFTDLMCVTRALKKRGADFMGLNPMHALFSDAPEQASPYSPSSRIFLNPLYIDVDAVPESTDCAAYADYKNSDRFQDVFSYTTKSNAVFYDFVSELKLTALGFLFDVFKSAHLDEKGIALTPRGESFVSFCQKYGTELDNFATFQVLRQYFKSKGKSPLWWNWDKGYQSPDAAKISAFQDEYASTILFEKYIQFLAFEQFDDARQCFKDENYGIGLYTDMPVSVGFESAEVWANQHLFLQHVDVGSPPDMFNKKGQNWSLSAFNPRELKRSGYALFIRIVQNLMQGSGAIRIDHAFGLMRLYLRTKQGEGAYLRFPFDDLMGIVALESMRNKCLVIAEDLGTPPAGFHDQMRAYRALSFRLFRYQKYGDMFMPPQDYDRMCMITPGTHDLPTYSAFWKGLDLDLARDLKTISLKQYKEDVAKRPIELSQMIDAFNGQGLPTSADPLSQETLPDWFIPDTYAYLARSNSLLLAVRLEDILEQDDQVNLPGTYMEYPNWRFKLPVYLEDFSKDRRIKEIADIMDKERR